MPLVQLDVTDTRPASVLRLIGAGFTAKDAAHKVGVNRKTIARWRSGLAGFGEAYNRALLLSHDGGPVVREALDRLVREWTPGELLELHESAAQKEVAPAAPSPVTDTSPASEPEHVKPDPAPERPPAKRTTCVDPDVLDERGKELTSRVAHRPEPDPGPAPYTTARPPTPSEWTAEMAKLALDPSQPASVRAVAIAAVSSRLNGGPMRGQSPADIEEVTGTVRGRDPGVPASVWKEARKNFLGPAPDAEPEAEPIGDVVEFERAPG